MIHIARFLADLAALDPSGRRAIEATFADWRHELLRATTSRRRMIVNARSGAGVVRALANVGLVECPSAWHSSFVVRLVLLMSLWVIWMLGDGPPVATERFFLATSKSKAWTLVAAYLVPQLLTVFPVMVFVAEAVGRRTRVTRVAGTLVLLSAFVLLSGFVVLPASWVYYRYETWRHFANASVAEPDLSAIWALGIVTTTFAIGVVWLSFVFANRIRTVGGVVGWGIGTSALLVAILVGTLPLILAVTAAPNSMPRLVWGTVALIRPVVVFGSIAWAIWRLGRINAARLNSSGAAKATPYT